MMATSFSTRFVLFRSVPGWSFDSLMITEEVPAGNWEVPGLVLSSDLEDIMDFAEAVGDANVTK